MAFPNKKFLGLFKDGWEDLGKVEGTYVSRYVTSYKSHALCKTTVHIGREKGNIFTFCPRCLVKTRDQNK